MKGWSWDSLFPYFKKSEAALTMQVPEAVYPGGKKEPDHIFDTIHGRHGPIPLSYNEFYSGVTLPYVRSVNALGIPTNSDPYGGHALGIYNAENAIDRVKHVGVRTYSANTYYEMSKSRSNLTLFSYTQVGSSMLTAG